MELPSMYSHILGIENPHITAAGSVVNNRNIYHIPHTTADLMQRKVLLYSISLSQVAKILVEAEHAKKTKKLQIDIKQLQRRSYRIKHCFPGMLSICFIQSLLKYPQSCRHKHCKHQHTNACMYNNTIKCTRLHNKYTTFYTLLKCFYS